MDKLFGQFKLQNFLRQMFCGVVFLLPFFIFPSVTQLCPCVPKFYAFLPQPGDFDFAQLTALAVIASIVGTIIYHIEKNVLSYPVQMFFRLLSFNPPSEIYKFRDIFCRDIRKKIRDIGYTPIIARCVRPLAQCLFFLIILGTIIYLLFDPDCLSPFEQSTSLIVASCWIVLVCLLTSALAGVWGIVDDTRKLWALEDREKETSGDDDKAILKRVGTWSDFIHCGQSCAIAWILGSLLCNASLGGCLSNDTVYRHGIFLAVVLLILEVFIDWHRYQHVHRILNPGTPGD